jgi:predicted amidohydrolase YtcJ
MRPVKAKIVIEKGKVVSASPADRSLVILEGIAYTLPDLFILPSFVESHAHIMGQGEKLLLPDISSASSFDDLIQLAKSTQFRKGDWLFLRGWDDSGWDSFPATPISALDSIFPDTPVALTRIDGHAMFVNSRAIEVAQIDTNNPMEGGSYIYTPDGTFSGQLLDNAMEEIYKAIPEYHFHALISMIESSQSDFLSHGITEVHDMDVYLRYLPVYIKLAKENRLHIKIRSFIRAFDGVYLEDYPKPFKVGNLEVCGLKFYADGALGSRGALLLGDYADKPGERGLQLISNEELYERAKKGCENGWEIAVHAIGDAAVRNVLDVYEKLRADGLKNILRIEHSQIVSPDDLHRFKKLGVIPSVQPIHCTSDSRMASERLGDRLINAYPWRSFTDQGSDIIAGSDAPIESNSVLEGINAFVNRIPKRPTDNWHYGEKISVDDAIRSYCLTPRYSHIYHRDMDVFQLIEETNSFIILDNDFENTDPSSILATRIYATVSNGFFHYSSQESPTA